MTYALTVQRISHRLLLCLSSRDKSLLIFLRDITQAFIQSGSFIQRRIFVEPPFSLKLGPNSLLHVVKPLYGLPESGLYWFETYHQNHTDNTEMKHAVVDMCFLFRKDSLLENSKIRGEICLQTDDTLNLGTAAFTKIKEKQSQKIVRKPIQVLLDGNVIFFSGISIHLSDGILSVEQEFHIRQLTAPNETTPVDKSSFFSQRTRGTYIASLIRPDLFSGFEISAQVQNPTVYNAFDLNKLIQQAKEGGIRLKFTNLNTTTIRVAVFTDASFAKNLDISSKLGYLMLLADEQRNANLLDYRSFKSKIVARSALSAELFALSHAYDVASTVTVALNDMLNTQLLLKFYTDCKSFFDGLIGINAPTKNRLLIDLSAIRQSCGRREITEAVWIPTNQNPADPLTTPTSSF